MDYEKAYKAVLKTATQWIKDGCTDKEKICLECVFPELRESEDERIRQGIVETIKQCTDILDPKNQKRMLDWLEKQKEQTENATKTLAKILKDSAEGFRRILKKKGIDYEVSNEFWENTAGVYSKEEDIEFHKWMDDLMGPTSVEETYEYKKGLEAGMKQKEPEKEELVYRLNGLMQEYINEAKDQEEEEHRFKCYKLFWNALEDTSYFEQKEQKPVEIHNPTDEEIESWRKELTEFKKFATKQAKENQLHISYTRDVMWENFCSELLSFVNSRKPAEWSEEDETYFPIVLDALDCFINGRVCSSMASHDVTEQACDWFKNRLKSLRPQPKQEWSEKDETAFGDLVWCIEQARKSAKDENDMGNIWFAENWVRNRLKSLHPSFKPSEEQMTALRDVITMKRAVNEFAETKLRELYDQLMTQKEND